MNIAIVGGGISGVFAAIKIKEKNPDYNVTIFEHNNKLLKKIYVTGNGKCNFANTNYHNGYYKNACFVEDIYKKCQQNSIISFFQSLGIVVKKIDDLYYPESLTAITVANALLAKINELKIKVRLNENIVSYVAKENNVEICSNISTYNFDKVIFAIGGKSFKNLGNDGLLFDEFRKHGYSINALTPSLCPIYVFEKTKPISGLRREATISLKIDKKLVYQEKGEILFKDNGLSGIAIFNVSHLCNIFDGEKEIDVDIAPDIKENILVNKYNSYFHPDLASYLKTNSINPHHMIFHYKGNYDFEFSQVSDGGVSIDNIGYDLKSNLEHNIYFIGESIDVSGICGGFNIMFCYACAALIAQSL